MTRTEYDVVALGELLIDFTVTPVLRHSTPYRVLFYKFLG